MTRCVPSFGRLSAVGVWGIGFASGSSLAQEPSEAALLVERALPHVVTLRAYDAAGNEIQLGSGFFLPDGRIATNSHVIAGAEWVDEPVVVDRNMVSSRRPDDLPDFCRGIIELLASGG